MPAGLRCGALRPECAGCTLRVGHDDAMRWFALILLVLLVLLQVKLWLGDGGIHDSRELDRAVELQAEENRSLDERNQALMAEVEDLKEGQDAIEERARTDLGMIREDESFYQVIEDDTQIGDEDTGD